MTVQDATDAVDTVVSEAEARGVTNTVRHVEYGTPVEKIRDCIEANDIHGGRRESTSTQCARIQWSALSDVCYTALYLATIGELGSRKPLLNFLHGDRTYSPLNTATGTPVGVIAVDFGRSLRLRRLADRSCSDSLAVQDALPV